MRKIVLVVLVVAVWFLYTYRLRLIIRDPLGSVSRAGVHEQGAQVFINYNNDVLLENDHAPMYFNMVQHDLPVSVPASLKCIHYLFCLAPESSTPEVTALPGAQLQSMTSTQVRFKDPEQRDVLIQLR